MRHLKTSRVHKICRKTNDMMPKYQLALTKYQFFDTQIERLML